MKLTTICDVSHVTGLPPPLFFFWGGGGGGGGGHTEEGLGTRLMIPFTGYYGCDGIVWIS